MRSWTRLPTRRAGGVLQAVALVVLSALFVAADAQAQQPDSVVAREIANRALRSYYGNNYGIAQYAWYFHDDSSSRRASLIDRAERLNRALDSAAARSPLDAVLAQSRIWHRIRSMHYAAADSMAESNCAAGVWSDWWCSAMLGFTKFNRGDGAAADKHFNAALASMPGERRCLWTDVSYVLNDLALTRLMKGMPCGVARDDTNAAIWWLADPLWTVPGNERSAAHFARWTEAMLAEDELRFLKFPEFHTDRMNARLEYYLRVGWMNLANGYSLGCGMMGRLDCVVRLNYLGIQDRFMPWAASVREPFSATVFDYHMATITGGRRDLNAEVTAPLNISDFSLRHNDRFQDSGELHWSSAGKMHTIRNAQTGMILRRSGPVLLAAFEPRFSSLYRAANNYPGRSEPGSNEAWAHGSPWMESISLAPMTAAVAASRGPRAATSASDPVRVFAGDVARISLALEPETDSAIVSVEARTVPGGTRFPVAARHRFAVFNPAQGVTGAIKSSDVILYKSDEAASQPASADEVLSAMLTRSAISSNEVVGLYWEVYGLQEGEQPEFELRMSPVDSGTVLSALTRAVGLSSYPSETLMRFQGPLVRIADVGPEGEKAFTLRVDFRSLKRGDYVMQMVTTVGGSTVAVKRLVRVTE